MAHAIRPADAPPWVPITVTDIVEHHDGEGMTLVTDDGRRLDMIASNHDRLTAAFAKRQPYGDAHLALSTQRSARVVLEPHKVGRIRNRRIIAVAPATPRIHPIERGILSAYGIDVPAACRWISTMWLWWTDGIEAPAAPHRHIIHRLDGRLTAAFPMDPAAGRSSMIHYSEGCIATPPLPATIIASAAGMRLQDIIAIPALAHLDICIADASTTTVGCVLDVAPSTGCETITDDPHTHRSTP